MKVVKVTMAALAAAKTGEMKHPEYMNGFTFSPPMGIQGDPDEATIDARMMMKKGGGR